MSDMLCSVCHQYGIYWKNLATLNTYTYCPHCENTNCQIVHDEDEEEEEPNHER